MKIGIDWGGTKIEGIILDPNTYEEIGRKRVDAPKDEYQKIIDTVVSLVNELGGPYENFSVGIGMPGSLAPDTNLVQVSNTEALEGSPVKKDIEERLGYEVKVANDADCLALSEAIDGAGKEYKTVFAVILGTGVGAGLVVEKRLVVGPNKITGEWGQNPIPGPMDDYEKTVKRHCGRVGAIEVFISGPGMVNDYKNSFKRSLSSYEIVEGFNQGDSNCTIVMDRYFERVARSFSSFINILDPDIIVCGGGMSEIEELYKEIPKRILPYIASVDFSTPIVPSHYGSTSGVRGAAHLWS